MKIVNNIFVVLCCRCVSVEVSFEQYFLDEGRERIFPYMCRDHVSPSILFCQEIAETFLSVLFCWLTIQGVRSFIRIILPGKITEPFKTR